jgi:uncharacterized GH25 family protein
VHIAVQKKRVVGLTLGLILAAAGNAVAHDTFILPDKFRVSKGEGLTIAIHSSDGFPDSARLPNRLQNAALHSASGTVPINNLREDGKRMIAAVAAPGAGHLIATITVGTATTTMKPDSFLDYIKEEGLTHVIDARARQGESDKPGRERYTMYAKSIILAGTPDETYKRAVGLPIEFVPEKDPYQLKAGESLPVRVLLRGAPAKDLEVRSAVAGPAGSKTETLGRTDANGRIMVPVVSGKWRLHAIYMARVSDPEADWESLWATLTFEIR